MKLPRALAPLPLLIGLTVCMVFSVGHAAAAAPSADQEAALLRDLAEDGNAGAQVQVAIRHLDGSGGFFKNTQLAVRWFERAAMQGNAYAEFRLGELYQEGIGIPRNSRVAADWMEKAANRGIARAQLKLGLMYARGDGVAKQTGSGRYWLERASIEGNQEARAVLANLREAGLATANAADSAPRPGPEAYDEAMRVVHLLEYAEFKIEEAWHNRLPELQGLAEDGDQRAQFEIGTYYLQGGMGRPRDVGTALRWYRRAAEGGSRRAALALARVYREGLDDVAADPEQARRWAARAASLPPTTSCCNGTGR